MSELDRDLDYLGHMLDHARKAVAKTESITREVFDADENLRLALTHLVQVVGEAASKTSKPFRETYSETPWTQIMGMRHRIVHDYLHVDEDILWAVVTMHLPPLIIQLAAIIDKLSSSEPNV